MQKLQCTGVVAFASAFLASTTWASAASTPPAPISGCVNQTISNGLWSLKVTNAVLGTEPAVSVAAYGVTMTLQNVGKKEEVPDTLGVGLPQVVLKDGTKLDISTDSQIAFGQAYSYTTFKPGMQVSGTYWFRTSDVTNHATAFVLPVSPTNSVYGTSLGYAMKNPSLSVDLTCNKSPSPSPSH
jgi:hypothetical protein